MKTKLLKKIRKRFKIEYYPKEKVYRLKGYYIRFKNRRLIFKHKQDAVDEILYQVKCEYNLWSCREKNLNKQNKPIKVWYGW